MFIYIKLIDNTKHKFEVDINTSVLLLKTQIYDYLQIDVRNQRLLYGGFTLLDECTLAMYQIKEYSIINLLYQLY